MNLKDWDCERERERDGDRDNCFPKNEKLASKKISFFRKMWKSY